MHAPGDLLYLTHERLQALDIRTAEVIDSIEHLIRGRENEKVWNAPKSAVTHPDGRYFMATLAAADDPPLLAVKSLVLNPRNPERGLMSINALVTLLDSETGVPLAIVDGNWVTAVRTAGLSAVAARRLARTDSAVAAFVGCGVQAHSHLQAFSSLFALEEVRAFGRGSTNRDALCEAAAEMGCKSIPSSSAESAVRDADLIVSSVPFSVGLDPFIDARWLKPGAFASITDLAAPWMDEGLPAFDRIVIDDAEQESKMPDPLVARELVSGDISDLVNGRLPGRENAQQRIAFVFRGLALGDLALAALAFERANAASGVPPDPVEPEPDRA